MGQDVETRSPSPHETMLRLSLQLTTVSRGLDALEKGLQERVEGYQKDSFKRYVGEYEFIEMLNREDLDIVGVFSPHSLHDIHVKYALRAGWHVLVEKPMANIVGDAITITKIAMGSDLHLVGGYQRHYENTYIAGKQAISEGLIVDHPEV